MSNLRLQLRNKIPKYTILLPTALSLTRIFFSPFLYILLLCESYFALPLYTLACLTDLLDGSFARILNTDSHKGGLLDASADFMLIMSGFLYYTLNGLVSPLLLLMMAISYTYYITTIGFPVKSVVGKQVGTILYALLALVILFPSRPKSDYVSLIGVSYVFTSIVTRYIKINRL